MKPSIHPLVRLLLLFICFNQLHCKIICPRQCRCDSFETLHRAACTHHNIVDVSIGVPKYVQIYNLSHNSISKIEDFSFQNMDYKLIEQLDLSHNMIFWVGLHAFAGLNKLKDFDLSYNRLQLIPNDLFSYNKNLTTLNLSNNKFTKFSNLPFLSHDGLKNINLSYCQISFLPKYAFQELPNLTELDLRGNYMIGLRINIFESVNKLKFINLNNNSWNCDDDFVQLEDWFLDNQIKYQIQCNIKIKKFEEMKMHEPNDHFENKEQDLDELWVIDDEFDKTEDKTMKAEVDDTFLMLYNERVPSLISLLVGFQIGIVLGILGTYCWTAKLYKCKKIVLPNRRHIRRLQRMNQNEVRENLLWNFIQEENFATPPSVRRQLSSFTITRNPSPQNTNSEPSGVIQRTQNISTDSQSTNDHQGNRTQINPTTQNREHNRSETPPPTYNDCLGDVIITSSK